MQMDGSNGGSVVGDEKVRRRKVTLLYLGAASQGNRLINLDLRRLARRLNQLRGQDVFDFFVPHRGIDIAGDLNHPKDGELGGPDYHASMYMITPLLERLKSVWAPRQKGGNDIAFGILRSPLTHDEEYSDESGSCLGEEYYSLSDLQQCAVVTTSRAMLENVPKGKTVEQYVAYVIAGELVNIVSQRDLMHPGDTPCLLNDCNDRAIIGESMDCGGFCPRCTQILTNCVCEAERKSITAILRWCKEDSWRHTAKEVLSHPLQAAAIAGVGPIVKAFVAIAISGGAANVRFVEYASKVVESISWDLLAPVAVFLMLFLNERRESRCLYD